MEHTPEPITLDKLAELEALKKAAVPGHVTVSEPDGSYHDVVRIWVDGIDEVAVCVFPQMQTRIIRILGDSQSATDNATFYSELVNSFSGMASLIRQQDEQLNVLHAALYEIEDRTRPAEVSVMAKAALAEYDLIESKYRKEENGTHTGS